MLGFCIEGPFSYADITETIESAEPADYCIPQTLVRGGFENLIIDHNMIIPPMDHARSGDIFVGARLKSQPDTYWLLSGITWRKIEEFDDLLNSQYQHFDQLPFVVPISLFNSPINLSEVIGDLEIWVGYGLRSAAESTTDSFNEMNLNERYELLWVALPPPSSPATGVINLSSDICVETTKVRKITRTVSVGV